MLSVYLELAADGRCMAHVIDLLGCAVRAETRESAMQRLPDAVAEYSAWLRRHGEALLQAPVLLRLSIAGEQCGTGPFDPGDAAALWPPDREPIDAQEMERAFRLMAWSRSDLLALTQDLPQELLAWRPDPDSFSIGRILRHIGNAEEWYVSRVVAPEALPQEWNDDQGLPIFEFLEMERRTAQVQLRALDEGQRSAVFYPSAWTDHPEEAWTVRKVLRRFVEHEREHLAQIAELLAAAGEAGVGWRCLPLQAG
jgi:uncharacterized damage-inducible protein DinB/predicted RNase H-like HicB family nuclease